jgi:hypothetical protein
MRAGTAWVQGTPQQARRKVFFFEKKKQKTFTFFGGAGGNRFSKLKQWRTARSRP